MGRKRYPGQKLKIEQAIAAYTTGAAFAEFAEKQKGKLAPGMLADFVVLDRDITAVAPAKDSGDESSADGGRGKDGLWGGRESLRHLVIESFSD